MAFGPIVRDSVSKDVAIAVECTRRNGTRSGIERLKTYSPIFIPEVEGAIGTASGECALYGVEGDVIHGIYQSLIVGIRSRIATMAFEREIVL
jgi:hypothetical protein